jgi:FkbM family methyltransferase
MSKTVSTLLVRLAQLATRPMKPYRRMMTRSMIAEKLVQRHVVPVSNANISFESPSARSLHDSLKLSEGEPETIRWIDGLPEGAVLWDIGANIGVYSLYAATTRRMHVLAFEPSASSYAALVRNIEINDLDDLIEPYCIAFSDATKLGRLHLAETGAGHSMHTLGGAASGESSIESGFRQAVPGFSIDEFCEIFAPPPPEYIKLDVDGIEQQILTGGRKALNRDVKSIIVEIDMPYEQVASSNVANTLAEAGFQILPTGDDRMRNVVFVRRES